MGRVLIVEDEFLIAMSLEYTLQAAGHEVRVARDGRQALDELRSFAADVVVTDYMMPRMDGSELIGELRRSPERRQIKILLSTSLPRDRLSADLDYDTYLRKPANEERLLAAVEELCAPASGRRRRLPGRGGATGA